MVILAKESTEHGALGPNVDAASGKLSSEELGDAPGKNCGHLHRNPHSGGMFSASLDYQRVRGVSEEN